MKVGLIYTSTTPELIELVEQEVKKQLGDDVELYSLQDPSILADVRAAGYVTTAPAARLIGMYMKAAEEGVDAMLNLCSSVGEVADSAQDVAKYIGVPIVRVDEEMCREAVRKGQRIGVMATLPTTLEPTKAPSCAWPASATGTWNWWTVWWTVHSVWIRISSRPA